MQYIHIYVRTQFKKRKESIFIFETWTYNDFIPQILSNVHLKRQLDNVDRTLAIAKNNLAKTSNENWIPEEVRMRSMYREFQVN